jgi:hypothetical protein
MKSGLGRNLYVKKRAGTKIVGENFQHERTPVGISTLSIGERIAASISGRIAVGISIQRSCAHGNSTAIQKANTFSHLLKRK